MVCGGYYCSRHSLVALNILYGLVGVHMMAMGTGSRWFGILSSINVVAASIAVGVFLLFLAIVGIYSTVKHSQFLLLVYMVILFIVSVMQFSVSCACLALNKEELHILLETSWKTSEETQRAVERVRNCCGFFEFNNVTCAASCFHHGHPSSCQTCAPIMQKMTTDFLYYLGSIGFFFSFTAVWGLWLTHTYRQQEDPYANVVLVEEPVLSPESQPL